MDVPASSLAGGGSAAAEDAEQRRGLPTTIRRPSLAGASSGYLGSGKKEAGLRIIATLVPMGSLQGSGCKGRSKKKDPGLRTTASLKLRGIS